MPLYFCPVLTHPLSVLCHGSIWLRSDSQNLRQYREYLTQRWLFAPLLLFLVCLPVILSLLRAFSCHLMVRDREIWKKGQGGSVRNVLFFPLSAPFYSSCLNEKQTLSITLHNVIQQVTGWPSYKNKNTSSNGSWPCRTYTCMYRTFQRDQIPSCPFTQATSAPQELVHIK